MKVNGKPLQTLKLLAQTEYSRARGGTFQPTASAVGTQFQSFFLEPL